MDLKSFYKKIDVDSIKNKLPPIPQMKIPKIKSRKIFKSSHEDIAQQQAPMSGQLSMSPQSLPPPPPSDFIDRTPTRISTVSSLMNINSSLRDINESRLSTYRTASNFEAENYPDKPENGDTSSGSAATKFGDRCRKTYKDFTEFRVKSIFQRKTVVKKTEIEVDMYARQFDLERREQEELDNQMDDGCYEFEFKEARRLTSRSSGSISPPDSLASGVPSPIRSELGRLQRNVSPTLLARRRNEEGPSRMYFQRSISEDSATSDPPRKPMRSSLWGISERKSEETGDEQHVSSYRAGISRLGRFTKSRKDVSSDLSQPEESPWSMKGIRNRFSTDDSGSERKSRKAVNKQESLEESSDQEKKGWKLRNMHLREPQNNDPQISSPEGKFTSIKKSIKRLNQRKVQHGNSEESEREQNNTDEPYKPNVSEQIKAGLQRLKMRERSFSFEEADVDGKQSQGKTSSTKTPQNPQSATNRLRNWKKSFKNRNASDDAPTDDDIPSTSRAPPGRSTTLMRKLNYIRSKKVSSEDGEDPPCDEVQRDEPQRQKSSNTSKLENARGKAIKKVNEQVQKIKMFHAKSRDSVVESSPVKSNRFQKSIKSKKPVSSDQPKDKAASKSGKTTSAAWATNTAVNRSGESSMDISDVEDLEQLQVEVSTRPKQFSNQNTTASSEKPKDRAKPGKKTSAAWVTNTVLNKSADSSNALSDVDDIEELETLKRPQKPFKPAPKDPVISKSGKIPSHAWATNPLVNRSADPIEISEVDSDEQAQVPRVLIHQDNSDQYESTLIIAVARAAPPIPSPIIKEIHPKGRPPKPPTSEWIPNKDAISSFLEMTPSPPRSTHQLDINRGHFRKRSMDSNDSDSWIPDNYRNKSCSSSTSTGLNKIKENTEPWKVHSVYNEEKLYKTKSIDIFSNTDAGAFVDFEDEMRHVPVRRIEGTGGESIYNQTEEDDYINTSKIQWSKGSPPIANTPVAIEKNISAEPNRSETFSKSVDSTKAYHGSPVKIVKKGQIGNSQESLDASYDDMSSDEDDEPPNIAPSPPPSFSPPPPPLPQRKPPTRTLPERNESMVRLANPLVKQASLRRHFSEEIEPSDLGKVNKLICRFEKEPSQDSVQRIQLVAGDGNGNDIDDDYEDVWKVSPPEPEVKIYIEVEEKKPPPKMNKEGGPKNGNKKRPAPVPKLPDSPKSTNNNNIDIRQQQTRSVSPDILNHRSQQMESVAMQSPSSVYGSPIGSVCLSSSDYGSPVGMTYPTQSTNQLRAVRRLSNRSSLRDDDTFYSFESDEENNFYSFGESSTSSTKYTIEI